MSDLYVVTGAAGFIGRNVVAALNARGDERIVLVDCLGHDEKWKNLIGLKFENMMTPEDFLAGVQGGKAEAPKAIIHLGACSSTTETNADYLLKNNTHYTMTLCQWALAKGTRFVYASSGATYGDGSLGYSDDDAKTPSYVPLNMYGYSKHLFDLWALSRGLLKDIAGLKYFNVYGPYEDHKGEMRSVVQKSYHQIMTSGQVQLFKSYREGFADGEQKRDFVYVKDAVDVTLHFVDKPRVNGLFNCGTGQARSWNDLVKAVFKAMNKEPKIEYIDMPETLRPKYQYFTQADAKKLREAGKYTKAFTSLEDGVKDYVESYLSK
jgi:ADP-L-glycero-D-manno-heptose 6-epimerase